MTKIERLAYLKNRHAELFGVSLPAVLPVTRAEIAGEARAVKARIAAAMDDSIADSDKIEAISSSLPFEEITEDKETETASLLSASERRQLARELREARAAAWLAALPRIPLLMAG